MSFHSVPVDIIELILMRLDSPIYLVRASSTCKLWRQIIAGAAFLQRFRSLHELQVIGSYHDTLCLRSPRFEPSSSLTINSSYLSLDFLPVDSARCSWIIKHTRGSLLLLAVSYGEGLQHRDMLICDPLNQRYEKIPPLTASPPQYQTDVFLLNVAEPGEIGISNFRIFYLSMPDGVAGIFTSGGSWRKLSIDHVQGMEYMGFAAGSLYYYSCRRSVYALDQGATEFSSSLLPDAEDFDEPKVIFKLAVTTGPDGRARILLLNAGANLKILAREKGSRGCGDWVPEKSIQLSAAMLGVPSFQQCFLRRPKAALSSETKGTVQILVFTALTVGRVLSMFNLDIETKQLEETTYETTSTAYPIKMPWPPSLHACTDHA